MDSRLALLIGCCLALAGAKGCHCEASPGEIYEPDLATDEEPRDCLQLEELETVAAEPEGVRTAFRLRSSGSLSPDSGE